MKHKYKIIDKTFLAFWLIFILPIWQEIKPKTEIIGNGIIKKPMMANNQNKKLVVLNIA